MIRYLVFAWTLPVFFLVSLTPGESVASHGDCPTEFRFPFLDLDGNLCHDTGDSGDVSGALVFRTDPFEPSAGNLVCPRGATLLAQPTDEHPPAGFLWNVPGAIALDCKLRSKNEVEVAIEAGEDVRIDLGSFSTRIGAVRFTSRDGTVRLVERNRIKADEIYLESGTDLVLEKRAGTVSRREFHGEAGGDVVLVDRTKIVVKQMLGAFFPFTLTGENVWIGNRVTIKTGRSASDIFIGAEPSAGVISAERLNAKVQGVIMEAGTIQLGPKSSLRTHDFGAMELTARDAIVLDDVKLQGVDAHLRVRTAGTLTLTNSAVRMDWAPIVLETAPGGICDVTGTVFKGGTEVEFVGCTPVGL